MDASKLKKKRIKEKEEKKEKRKSKNRAHVYYTYRLFGQLTLSLLPSTFSLFWAENFLTSSWKKHLSHSFFFFSLPLPTKHP